VPPLAPAAMASEAAPVRMLPVVLRPTVAPPEPAGPLSVTAQVAVAPGANDRGLHTIELIVTPGVGKLTVPPVPVTGTVFPFVAAPTVLITPMLEVEPDTVADTVAITPSAIVFAFMPLAMQV